MKNSIFVFLLVALISTHAHSQETKNSCNGEKTLSRVYSAINKYICMGAFYDGNGILGKNMEKGFELGFCSAAIFGGTAALLGGGLLGAKISEKVGGRKSVDSNLSRLENEQERLYQAHDVNHKLEKALYRVAPYSAEHLSAKENLNATNKRLRSISSELIPEYQKSSMLYNRSIGIMGYSFKAASVTAAIGIFGIASSILDASPAGCSDLIHMYTDFEDNCRYRPEIGPNTARYLNLPLEEQKKIMSQIPEMCRQYTELAIKLESDLDRAFPSPDFKVTSCGPNNEVTSVDLKYPAESFSVKQNNSGSLSVETGATHRVNLELLLKQGEWGGMDSLSTVRANMKTSKVSRTHIPSDILKDPSRNNSTAQRELATSLRALHGFTSVKTIIGNQCRNYLEQQSNETEATSKVSK